MKIEDTGWKKTKKIYNSTEVKALLDYFKQKGAAQQKVYQLSHKDQKNPLVTKAISYFQSEIRDCSAYTMVKLYKILVSIFFLVDFW